MPIPYIRSFVFQKNTVTRASMPPPYFRSFQENTVTGIPVQTKNSVRVPREYGDQNIHAQTIIPFVSENTVTRANHNSVRVEFGNLVSE